MIKKRLCLWVFVPHVMFMDIKLPENWVILVVQSFITDELCVTWHESPLPHSSLDFTHHDSESYVCIFKACFSAHSDVRHQLLVSNCDNITTIVITPNLYCAFMVMY